MYSYRKVYQTPASYPEQNPMVLLLAGAGLSMKPAEAAAMIDNLARDEQAGMANRIGQHIFKTDPDFGKQVFSVVAKLQLKETAA